MAYEHLDNGDVGFKFLDNTNFADFNMRLNRLPYVFKRSDIANVIRTAPPHIVYLRNKTYARDYEIMFRSVDNLSTFLGCFPDREYDESQTKNYYFISQP